MTADPLQKPRSVATSIGTFVRRVIWRRELGPISAEARIEVRELTTEPEPQPSSNADTPSA